MEVRAGLVLDSFRKTAFQIGKPVQIFGSDGKFCTFLHGSEPVLISSFFPFPHLNWSTRWKKIRSRHLYISVQKPAVERGGDGRSNEARCAVLRIRIRNPVPFWPVFWLQNFLYLFKNKIIYNFIIFLATKMVGQKIILPLPLVVLLSDRGSEVEKNQDPG